jgi:hypothetical protein
MNWGLHHGHMTRHYQEWELFFLFNLHCIST